MAIRILVGPPCAGKSTMAWELRGSNDPVVDFDRIASALGSAESHNADGRVKAVAFKVRDAAIDAVLALGGDSWIIHTSPTAFQLGRYDIYGAEFILVDPGIDECLRRAEADGRPDRTADVIRAWYDSPPVLPQSG
ncbi:hypothetical protein ACXR2W_00855 [Leucobacter sp. HY1908]